MTTAAILEKTTTGKGHEGGPALISTEAFYRKYGQREDGFKYELVNGRIEKFKKTMNDSQLFISTNLHRFFFSLWANGKVQGVFQAEKDNELWKDHVRIPDMCYLNEQQLVEAYEGKHPVAEFVVEVVSPTDKAYKYSEKIEDYFKAGVKVVWMIYPNTKQVQVHLHNSTNVTYCKGEMICSAAPVLPEFAISVNDIFKKPTVD
jgi:Uma2 family endonuclease